MAVFGIVRPVDPVAVELPGLHVGEVAVPGLIRVFGERNAVQLAPPARIEEAELDLFGVLGEEREVDPPPIPGRTARIRPAGPDSRQGTQGVTPQIDALVDATERVMISPRVFSPATRLGRGIAAVYLVGDPARNTVPHQGRPESERGMKAGKEKGRAGTDRLGRP